MKTEPDRLRELVRHDERLQRALKLIDAKRDVAVWKIGRVCFRLFGYDDRTLETGLSIPEFAQERGCTTEEIEKPLRVYRVLGDFFERQIEPVPFSVAFATVEHTSERASAERLMDLWRKRNEPDEAHWRAFLGQSRRS